MQFNFHFIKRHRTEQNVFLLLSVQDEHGACLILIPLRWWWSRFRPRYIQNWWIVIVELWIGSWYLFEMISVLVVSTQHHLGMVLLRTAEGNHYAHLLKLHNWESFVWFNKSLKVSTFTKLYRKDAGCSDKVFQCNLHANFNSFFSEKEHRTKRLEHENNS